MTTQDDPIMRPLTPANPVEEDPYSEPPRVHPGLEDDIWVVEPPEKTATANGSIVFTGPGAREKALTYAYENFGKARFFLF